MAVFLPIHMEGKFLIRAKVPDVLQERGVFNIEKRMSISEYPDVMTVEDMCEYLRISTKTGYKLLREGAIKCLKPGKSYLIPKKYVLEFISI